MDLVGLMLQLKKLNQWLLFKVVNLLNYPDNNLHPALITDYNVEVTEVAMVLLLNSLSPMLNYSILPPKKNILIPLD